MSWLAIKLFLGGALKRLTGLFAVIGRYPWQTAVIVLLALSAGLWRGNVSKKQLIANIKAEQVKQIAICRKSVDTLQASLATQNAAVQALGDASAAKQKQSAKIVADAVERGKTAEVAAVRIEAERKVWPKGGPVCRTGEAVMAAKGLL